MLNFSLSTRARHTLDQPISYFMRQALENPHLISLAAGLVDQESLPVEEVRAAMAEIFSEPVKARSALQYGTTQGYPPLREKIFQHILALDQQKAADVSYTAADVVVTTGSQQLLYLVGEVLLDPGDIVIAEAPSYFVYHGALASLGARTLQVPMDEEGMDTNALEELLESIERSGELARVKMIYTVDYFQNPTSLTMSWKRRQHLMELVRRFSKKQRIFILEDAAYRELRFAGQDIASIKSLDPQNAHVILAMTFSKPMAPGLKTGYGVLPKDLVLPVVRFKGLQDFGSSNLNQNALDRIIGNGSYHQHAAKLRNAYRAKRDVLLQGLTEAFGDDPDIHWTVPEGGLYVWITFPPNRATGPGSELMENGLREGVLYVPGEFCYVNDGKTVSPKNEARLCYAEVAIAQVREAVRRLGRAYHGQCVAEVAAPKSYSEQPA